MENYKIILLSVLYFFVYTTVTAQTCSKENAIGCACPNESSSCDLLPDITIDKSVFLRAGGYVEYSQTAATPNTGTLRVTVSTPNIGYGPIIAVAKDDILCDDQPYEGNPFGKCPDGSYPKRLINQVIYRKEGNQITSFESPAGYMEYHGTHLHMHTNDWEHMSLRVKTEGIDDPRDWPVVGTTVKTGFCLQDYKTCTELDGSCQNNGGDILRNEDLPNFSLGGGAFTCDPYEQGISVGYVDIYPYYYDGMDIRIPPETCNGQYQIVIEVDPLRQYMEQDTTNNIFVLPIGLTKQRSGFHPYAQLSFDRAPRQLCEGDQITLFGNPAFNYQWSTGETTPKIVVTESGTYDVEMNAPCGYDKTAPITLNFTPQPFLPTVSQPTTSCSGQSTLLQANSDDVLWYDTPIGGKSLAKGSQFETPILNESKTYYATIPSYTPANSFQTGILSEDSYPGGFHANNDGGIVFDTFQPVHLKSVKVIALRAGERTFELRGGGGVVLRDTTFMLEVGENIVNLDFEIETGNSYVLGLSSDSVGDLFRNTSPDIPWPFKIEDVLSISGSTAGPQYYYYFYDWKLEEQSISCTNKRVAVEVPVSHCATDLELATIAPNPAQNEINLFVPYNMFDIHYEIYDSNGRNIASGELASLSTQSAYPIDISSLSNGVYFLRLVASEGTVANKKFVVLR